MQTTEYQKYIGGRLVQRFIADVEKSLVVDGVLHANCFELEPTGRAREVVIFEVDGEIYDKRMEKQGAQPVSVSQTFPSAWAASCHFGYTHNAVAHALHWARKRSEQTAVVAGVRIGYADEIKGVD